MADYIYIKNYSRSGEIGISRRVFEQIVSDAVSRVSGASISPAATKKMPFNLNSPIKITFRIDGSVEIRISIILKKGVNSDKVCLAIQEEVARSITAYTESVPFQIELKVASFA